MREKEIELNGKRYKVRELLYLEVIELGDITNKREHAKKLMEISGIPLEDIEKFSAYEGGRILKEINEINKFEDFQ